MKELRIVRLENIVNGEETFFMTDAPDEVIREGLVPIDDLREKGFDIDESDFNDLRDFIVSRDYGFVKCGPVTTFKW